MTPGENGVRLSFFVPCLNEEGNVGRTIDTIVQVMNERAHSYEIIVVDDASVDGSKAEVMDRRERHPGVRIEIIQNRFVRGLGRNYFIAAQRASGEYFMLVNGDAAEPAESIRTLVSQLGCADAVVPYFGLYESRTWPRRFLSRSFTFLVNFLSGHRLKYYNGPVLHRTENVRVWFSETAGFAYQAELLCRLLDEGISVKEVRIANSSRNRGFSKAFTISNLLSVTNALFHIMLRRLEKFSFRVLLRNQKEVRKEGAAWKS
ncbi:MAG: glycosyltransferase family 2 protein [Candidatus Omnitrophica bacterium]|nr:glycosyltransferase family 2 protein [Candidatus Omnitrophota bacterium]